MISFGVIAFVTSLPWAIYYLSEIASDIKAIRKAIEVYR